ncbi:hypothetical protein CTAYLR_005800 [Chrysophaeum taylorii]|uniref:Altered inheritance of mitochondria protein 24, mitochondrial n=1 Tax=Chrysophaeum taylorii TaxID=2483200 RepID=A0AAD7UNU2_9STRA|nr:hypothetical protein CTAYLR_005800 [Chrysophaeum taylorii]
MDACSLIPEASVIGQRSAPPGYEFVGNRYTVVNKVLKPSETFIAEAGSMLHMSDGVRMSSTFGGVAGVANSLVSGEDIARVRFINAGSSDGFVGITPNQPMAVVVPVDLGSGGAINAKRGAYIAGPETVRPVAQILPATSCLACCCGGMPPIIQSVRGSGVAFLAAGGTVVRKTLARGESVLVDTHSVVAFSPTVGYDVKRVGSCVTCCFGGEGCFNTHLRGPGDVYIQSMSYEKLIDFLLTPTPAGGGDGDRDRDGDGGGNGAPPQAEISRYQTPLEVEEGFNS